MSAAQRGTRRSRRDDAQRRAGRAHAVRGWTTRDLAAHLVVRERRLDAAPESWCPPWRPTPPRCRTRWPDRAIGAGCSTKVASGPPTLSPFKLLDPLVNLNEMFIHHEDVRRAQPGWEPGFSTRTWSGTGASAGGDGADDDGQDAGPGWRCARRTARRWRRWARGPGHGHRFAEELLLFSVGREARVDFDGPGTRCRRCARPQGVVTARFSPAASTSKTAARSPGAPPRR